MMYKNDEGNADAVMEEKARLTEENLRKND
jgi:hypothetical protein